MESISEVLYRYQKEDDLYKIAKYFRDSLDKKRRDVYLGSFEYGSITSAGILSIHGTQSGRMDGPDGIREYHKVLHKIKQSQKINPGKYLVISCYNWKRSKRIVFKDGVEFLLIRPEHDPNKKGVLAFHEDSGLREDNVYSILVYEKR